MVDLKGQYEKIKPEIDAAIQAVIDSCAFVKGPAVKAFEEHLASYLNVRHVITCGNGTDALQVSHWSLPPVGDPQWLWVQHQCYRLGFPDGV